MRVLLSCSHAVCCVCGTHLDTVLEHRVHANEAFITDRAALQHCAVSYRYVTANVRCVAAGVERANKDAVLQVAACPDCHGVCVACGVGVGAQHRSVDDDCSREERCPDAVIHQCTIRGMDACAPRTVALYQMEQLSATLTSPDTCADGATQLVAATLGIFVPEFTSFGRRVTARGSSGGVRSR